eukprot:gene11943-13918_t
METPNSERNFCNCTGIVQSIDLKAGSLYACVTRLDPTNLGKQGAPILKRACKNGCQPGANNKLDATCIPDNTACKCTAVGDRCGSHIVADGSCSELKPHSIYGCDAVGSYPSLKWDCPNGCETPKVGGNDTCFRGPSNTEGLKKVKKIVIFMQENRAFDHYFASLPGVRGFQDPNPKILNNRNGSNVFYQPDSSSTDKINGYNYTLPFRLTGPKAGCFAGGTNGWTGNHRGYRGGAMDNWCSGISSNSMSYLTRPEMSYYYGLSDQFTFGDMYFQSMMASTNPNRLFLWSGMVDARGVHYPRGPGLDNNVSPPFQWLTTPEQYEKAGISWRVFQDSDNFDDNALEWFEQYIKAPAGNSLRDNGLATWGLDGFFFQARNGLLPQVSYVIAPAQLSEHPRHGPEAGEWLSQEIISALTSSPDWESTVLIINYDESGGFFDHVTPPVAPYGTKDEWISNEEDGIDFIGPGQRVPLMLVSPFSKGGDVYTETSDHSSTIMFIEQWALANGYGDISCPHISSYRRNFMNDLTHAFDFDHPVNSFAPIHPIMPMPSKNFDGKWDPTDRCEALPDPYTPIPWGNQSMPIQEAGYKRVLGNNPGPGRTYVFELNNNTDVQGAIQIKNNAVQFGLSAIAKNVHSQYFTMPQSTVTIGVNIVANDGNCLTGAAVIAPCSNTTDTWVLIDQFNGKGHVIKNTNTNKYVAYIPNTGFTTIDTIDSTSQWTVYAVTPTPVSADEGDVTTGRPDPEFDAASTLGNNLIMTITITMSMILLCLF